MKRIFMSIVLMPMMALAEISISNVKVFSGYPWKEVVIGYTITGNTDQPVGRLVVTATDNASGKTYDCKTLEGVGFASGDHVVKWNAVKDGAIFKSDKVVFDVRILPPPLYYVIDLSEGPLATYYPVTGLATEPSGGWTDEYKTNKLVLRRIEPGAFNMGDAIHNGYTYSKKLTQPFLLGVFEVTQRQWELVTGKRPSNFKNESCYASRPVEQISYDMIRGKTIGSGWPTNDAVDASSFLGKLRARTGIDFDLPTEAQWEYACRAGTTNDYNNGANYSNPGQDANMDVLGRYCYNSGYYPDYFYSTTCGISSGTAKVGSYLPNSWGLYDMHGNVMEWCLDWDGSLASSSTDPKGARWGVSRILRSGSWNREASDCTSSVRHSNPPSYDYFSYGFRLSRTIRDIETSIPVDGDMDALAETSSGLVAVDTTFTATKVCVNTEIPIAYGSVRAGASCRITINGESCIESASAGDWVWQPADIGRYIFEWRLGEIEMFSTIRVIPKDAPRITDLEVFSGYPWKEVVIGYKITGGPDQPIDHLEITALDNATGKTYECKTLEGVDLTPGSHVIKWNAAADGAKFKSDDVIFTVRIVPPPPVYCVIRLSGGTTAADCQVTGLDAMPSGGWTDDYKTAKLVLRRIEPGSFWLSGYRVTLTKPYYIGVFEVTQKQYKLVTGSNPSQAGRGDSCPVDSVSYNMLRGVSKGAKWPSSSEVDETSFMGKIQARTGLKLDLPTESQWEAAYRAGTTSTYYWGNSLDGDYAWISDNSNSKTHQVGGKKPNALGLYDMSGNVWEWCLDWYGSRSSGTDPVGKDSGTGRVSRGGSYNGSSCSADVQLTAEPDSDYSVHGFRLSWTLQDDWNPLTVDCATEVLDEVSSASVSVDTTFEDGTRLELGDSIVLAYGGVGVNGKCAIVANEVVLTNAAERGLLEWCPVSFGDYQLKWELATLSMTSDMEVVLYRTISFDTNGAEALAPAKLIEGKQYGELPTPCRDGGYFLGWYTDADGGEKVTAESMVDADRTLYAHWIVVSDIEVFSGYPWEEVVIGYKITGNTDWSLTLKVIAKDNVSGKSYESRTLEGVDLTPGRHIIKWNATADGAKFKSDDVVIAIRIVPQPLYCVIDLSGGTSVAHYPVAMFDEEPSGGWTDEYKSTKLVLRRIEPGTFAMQNKYDVKLTKLFYIGVFEVTQKQYELVMGENPSSYKGDMRPVDGVNYNMIRGSSLGAGWPGDNAVDATSFLGVLRAKTGVDFDLPTEAQWEYACRAGTKGSYNNDGSSQDDMNKAGRYRGNKSDGVGGYTDAHTKVGSYLPNAWGLYDMHGNVWEWCLDWHGSIGAAIDPVGVSSASSRVIRGGSYSDFADACATSYRSRVGDPSYATSSEGFRISRSLHTGEIPSSSESDFGAYAEAHSKRVSVDTTFGGVVRFDEPMSVAYGSVNGVGCCQILVNGSIWATKEGCGVETWMPTGDDATFVWRSGDLEMASEVRMKFEISVFSGYPWKDVVIGYNITRSLKKKMDHIEFSARDNVTGRTYECKTLEGLNYSLGNHVIKWDAIADGAKFKSADVVVTARIVPLPLYYVIDLSGGPSASHYKMSGLDAVPSGGWTDEYKTTKLVLRRIEPGSFKMQNAYDVTLTKPFYVGVFEVTQKQYELVTGESSLSYKGDMRPQAAVSYTTIRGREWDEGWPADSAVGKTSFFGQLRVKTGLDFDLPTEAQWEYACRAGTTSDYNNGGSSEEDLKKVGRYASNKNDGKGGFSDAHTTVGSYLPNAWGLYDMHGNVWEWCLDWEGDIRAGTDPEGDSASRSGWNRALRGGSWDHYANACMSSSRMGRSPRDGGYTIGFRIARTVKDAVLPSEEEDRLGLIAEAMSGRVVIDTTFEDGTKVGASLPVAYGSVAGLGCQVLANGEEIVNGMGHGVTNVMFAHSDEYEFIYSCGVTMKSTLVAEVPRMIQFDACGGTDVSPITLLDGSSYGTLPTTKRTGFIFRGWFTSQVGGEEVTADTIADSDRTLYAHWEEIRYLISFNANGGPATPAAVSLQGELAYGELPVLVRSGYAFLGWFTSASGGTRITEDSIVDSARTLYAHWLAYGCTISQSGLLWDIVIAQVPGSDGVLTLDGERLLSSSNEVVRFTWQPETKGSHELVYSIGGTAKKKENVNVTGLSFLSSPAPNPPTAPNANMTIKQTSHSFSVEGGAYSIPTAGVNGYVGSFTVSKSANWITINSAEVNWKAGRSIVYTVEANDGVEERTGYVYVGGHVHTITQAGVGAELSSYSTDVEAEGGEGCFTVLADAGTSWNARPNADWITISPTTGTGEKDVTFTVAPWNDVSTRSATITAAGGTFTVNQIGRHMKLDKSAVSVDYNAQAVELSVSALPFIEWDGESSASWISIADVGEGKGAGTVTLAVAENPSYLARTASVRIGTETVTISQAKRPMAALNFTIDPAQTMALAAGGTGVVTVVATPELPWSAQSKTDWLVLSPSTVTGTGDGGFTYTVEPNPVMAERSGTIKVSPEAASGLVGKTIVVVQSAATAEISEEEHEFAAKGETFEISVSVLDVVKWNITTVPNWVTIEGGTTRTGAGVVRVTAKENLSIEAREATIIIAGHDFKITQSGRTVKVDPPIVGVSMSGGDGTINVIADANVIWGASPSDMWISIWGDNDCDYDVDGNIVDVGSGAVNYYIDGCDESELPRTGLIRIGDKRVNILQTRDGTLVSVVDDPGAIVSGDIEKGLVVKPSGGKTAVEVTIPQGVDASKVSVEVSPRVASVKPNGAKVKVVVGENDITDYLVIPESGGVLNIAAATVKEEIVKEALDPSKDAVIELSAANPKLITAPTRKGLFYQLREGVTLGGMKDGDSTIGDGEPWTPEITVKGGNSAFYSIGVGKGE